MANQDIAADVVEVGELNCSHRRAFQVTLKAISPAEFPTSVAGIRLSRYVEVGGDGS